MLVSEFIKEFSKTTIRNSSLVDLTQPYYIKANELDTVLFYINNSLSYFYNRFNLLYKQCIIQYDESILEYVLESKYTLTSGSESILYIQDTVNNPFYPYILKIERVYAENGCLLALNDLHDCNSVFTIGYKGLQIPTGTDGQLFNVLYKANHVLITESNFTTEELILSPILIEAFKCYMAYNLFSNILGSENINESSKFYAQYNSKIKEIIMSEGITITSQSTQQSFNNYGFV